MPSIIPNQQPNTVKSVCPYCGVGCGIVMEVAGGRVIKVSGDRTHPTNFGRLCTKGKTCNEAIAASGRLDSAYLRDGSHPEPRRVGMRHAIQETAKRLRAIIDVHGPDALAFYVSGQMSLEAQYLSNKLAKGFIGTHNVESNSRLCMASASSGYKLSLGADGPPGSYQDFDQADVFFVIGSNMADCHPILFLRMMDRVKAGARLIVVDPRRTATAEKADLFLQIRPGTDLALMNGLLHLLVKNGHTDTAFISEFTQGWNDMPAFLDDYSPETVAGITGLAVSAIRQAAEWIGTAGEWMSCWTMGLNQSIHGTWNTNAVCNLHLATGAICRPGSGPFSLTGQPNAMGGREMGYMGPGLPGQRSMLVDKDRAFVEALWGIAPGSLRVGSSGGTVAMFDDMKAGAIKACWIICTNPVATVPNRDKVIAGLQAAELVIVQDAFLDTETSRHADILLPGALWAEAEGVMVNSERNLTLMEKAVDPPGDALADWQIIAQVACEMGYSRGFTYGSAAEVFDEIKRAWNADTGYDIRGASHERLREASLQWPCPPQDGNTRHPIRYLDTGGSRARRTPAQGSTPPRIVFATESGRAVFLPRPYLPPAEIPDDVFPFVLNTGRLQHQWHTMTKTGSIATLNKLNPGPFVEIHPQDAQTLGIRDKDYVEVRSRRGRAKLPAVVTDRVQPGHCFAPFHWNDVFGEALAINVVTSDAIDPISQQPAFKFCAVALTRVGQAPRMSAKVIKEIEMKNVDALAALLGLDAVPAVALEGHEQLYLQGFLAALRTDVSRQAGGVPVLPPSAPLESTKRVMLDGMLAGLFARTWLPDDAGAGLPGAGRSPASTISSGPPIIILWASSTGNAEEFAAVCAERLSAQGHAVQLACMDTFAVADLTRTSRLLLLASTFGDGDPPENGAAFWEALQADNAPRLDATAFSVLGFGDSSYDQFCGFGRKLDARLSALGARRLLEVVGCEPEFQEAAQAWLDDLTRALAADVDASADAPPGGGAPAFTRKNPLRARVLANRLLNGAGSAKETRQFVFDVAGQGLNHEVGDALGVWPTNCPDVVGDMLAALKLAPSAMVSLEGHGELTLAEALSRHCEITRITPDVLRLVSERSGSCMLAELLTENRKETLQQWLRGRQIADLLREFPIQVQAAEWLGVLKRAQPRFYSISSSPKTTPGQIHLTVSTLRYGLAGKRRGGACSTFLADRSAGKEIPIFVQKAPHFRPPANADAPMIMIGPGTGIAPFRAFLQERQAIGARGRNWLFFGEQHAASDFYYRDELEAMLATGHLHRLDTAFSRDQAEKIHVGHRMLEQGARLWSWLEDGGHFYVCGNADRMASDVDAALRKVLQTHGAMSTEAAADYVVRMKREKRYLRDVY